MKTRAIFAAIAATCFAMLQACDTSSTAATESSPPSAPPGATGALAFRLPADFVNNQLDSGSEVHLSVYGSKLESSIYKEFPADTNDIFLPNLRTGLVYVDVSIVNDLTGLDYHALDTIRIAPYQLNRLSLTLRRRSPIFPTGGLQVVLGVDTAFREDSAVSWKCRNFSPDFNYCFDYGLGDTSVVGPWNCSAWIMVGGKRTCQAWLHEVDAPTTDGYCAKRIEGSPMLCTQTRDKYDPYYKPVQIDTTADWYIKPIVK